MAINEVRVPAGSKSHAAYVSADRRGLFQRVLTNWLRSPVISLLSEVISFPLLIGQRCKCTLGEAALSAL